MVKYTIAGKTYHSRKEIENIARAILSSYVPPCELKNKDSDFMLSLLEQHPNYAEKVGVGIKTIAVGLNDSGQNEFQVVRGDNSVAVFSYKKCLSPSNPERDLRNACRGIIKPTITQFRQAHYQNNADLEGKIICPLSGKKISRAESHVDHIHPMTFDRIYEDWKSAFNIKPEDVVLLHEGQRGSEKRFKDNSLENSFLEYHNQRAKLRVVSQEGNLILAKRGLA